MVWLIGVTGLLGIGWLALQPPSHGDTGYYHYPAVVWLRSYGLVPGVALLNVWLGHSSAWYAFIAPFDTGWWHNRIGVTGGFTLVLLWLQSCITVVRAWRHTARVSDWLVFLPGLWLTVLTAYSACDPASLSTDIPVAALVVAAVWALVAGHEGVSGNIESTVVQPVNVWVPLLLAVGALTCKLSAAPATATLFLWAGWQTRRQPKQWLWLAGLVTLVFMPVTVVRFVSSGYPLFPSALGGGWPEWSASDRQTVSGIRHGMTQFLFSIPIRRYQEVNVTATVPEEVRSTMLGWEHWLNVAWVQIWLRTETLLVALLALSLVASVALLRRAARQPMLLWVVSLVWLSSIYILLYGPVTRYGLGPLVLLPSLWFAYLVAEGHRLQAAVALAHFLAITMIGMTGVGYARRSFLIIITLVFGGLLWLLVELAKPTPQQTLTTLPWSLVSRVAGVVGTLLVGAMLLVGLLFPNRLSWFTGRMLRPPDQPLPTVATYRVNDVELFHPLKPNIYDCWGSPLPCLSGDPSKLDIQLRDPRKGIAGGFKRRSPNS